MSDDAAKCRLIAKFEMPEMEWEHPDPKYLPDYPHDLNATMRAARRLPSPLMLVVNSVGGAHIAYGLTEVMKFSAGVKGDPARAAFEALAAYLENQTGAKR